MATPTRPCPHCGQPVLTTAAHCGYCGKPLPVAPAGAARPAQQPQKTMMGYALPSNFPAAGGGTPAGPVAPPAPRPVAPPLAHGGPPAAQKTQFGVAPGTVPSPSAPAPAAPLGGTPPAARTPFGAPHAAPPAAPHAAPAAPQSLWAAQTPAQPTGTGQPPAQPAAPAQPVGAPAGPAPHPSAAPIGASPQGGFGAQPPSPQAFTPPSPQPHATGAPPHGAPAQSHGAPAQPYGAPAQSHGAPAQPYGAPAQSHGAPAQPHGAPAQPYGAPAQPYGPPSQPYAAPSQPYGGPAQPHGAPAQQPYGGPAQPYGAPSQPYAAPSQPYGGPAQPHGAPSQPHGAGAPHAAPAGSILGLPLARLKDPAFLKKVLAFSAIALLVTRFLPVSRVMGNTMFTWDGPIFQNFIWPIVVAVVYGAIALAPRELQQKVPAPVLRWAPFLIAYFSAGWSYAVLPSAQMGAATGAMTALAWAYPLLVFGLIVRLQDEEDMIARGLILLGGLGALGAVLGSLDYLFAFSGMPALFVVHNILWFLVLVVAAGSLAFAPPIKMVPKLAAVNRFAPLATSVLIAWPPVAALLFTVFIATQWSPLNFVLVLPHLLVIQVAYLGVLLLTAPMAFETLKAQLREAGVATSAAAYGYPTGPHAPPTPAARPSVEQQLAELDAAWSRGGMTPEEYHQRRNAILAGR